jgi:hypothetical protein
LTTEKQLDGETLAQKRWLQKDWPKKTAAEEALSEEAPSQEALPGAVTRAPADL